MASLIYQKGIYSAQFYDRSRRPQRKRVPLQTRVRRDAERALRRMEGAVAIGVFDPWTQHWDPIEGEGREPDVDAGPPEEPAIEALGKAVDAYLASCSHLRLSTRKTYRDIVEPFARYVGRGVQVAELQPRHVLAWLDSTSASDVTR